MEFQAGGLAFRGTIYTPDRERAVEMATVAHAEAKALAERHTPDRFRRLCRLLGRGRSPARAEKAALLRRNRAASKHPDLWGVVDADAVREHLARSRPKG